MQDMERDLELKQNFFLVDNVDHKQKVIPKKTIKKPSNKNCSPTKVKSRNFLTSICYDCLKSLDFVNASFIIHCYTYIDHILIEGMMRHCGIIWFQMNFIFTLAEMTIFLC